MGLGRRRQTNAENLLNQGNGSPGCVTHNIKPCRWNQRHGFGYRQLLVMAWEDSHFEGDHEAAPGGQVDLVQRGRGSGCNVGRAPHGVWIVRGENIGDVFAVEEVIDAEADLRSVKDRVFFAKSVVEE